MFSRLALTQNTRLKANIRYLMHLSPPDSAAMAIFLLQILRLFNGVGVKIEGKNREVIPLNNSQCTKRVFVDALALASCAVRACSGPPPQD